MEVLRQSLQRSGPLGHCGTQCPIEECVVTVGQCCGATEGQQNSNVITVGAITMGAIHRNLCV